MFLLDRCQDIVLENLSIIVGGGKDLLAAAWIQNTPVKNGQAATPPPNTSRVWWRNVRVIGQGRLERGFEGLLRRRCHVRGGTRAAPRRVGAAALAAR
jgi:hypothetical protein